MMRKRTLTEMCLLNKDFRDMFNVLNDNNEYFKTIPIEAGFESLNSQTDAKILHLLQIVSLEICGQLNGSSLCLLSNWSISQEFSFQILVSLL